MIENGILNLYTLNFLERIGEGLYFVLSLFEITATVSSFRVKLLHLTDSLTNRGEGQ